MSTRYEITGLPESGDLEYSAEYQVRLVRVVAPPDSGDTLVVLTAVPNTDAGERARIAYAAASRTLDPHPNAGQLAVAAALLLACEKLDSIDDALRNTVGGTPTRSRNEYG